MRIVSFSLAAAVALAGCTRGVESPDTSVNKFTDPVFVKIADLQDRRQTDSLLVYLAHDHAGYRQAAALAFASVQDSAAVEKLGASLKDAEVSVRLAAAYALGQTVSRGSAQLLSGFIHEKDDSVRAVMLEAYGKVAARYKALEDPQAFRDTTTLGSAMVWSLYRAAVRNKVDTTYSVIPYNLLEAGAPTWARFGAAQYFSRPTTPAGRYTDRLIAAAKHDPDALVRMSAALALKKAKADTIVKVLTGIITADKDYRVRVSAVRALQAFPLEHTWPALQNALLDQSLQVQVAASEVMIAVAAKQQAVVIAESARAARDARVKANLYEAALVAGAGDKVLQEVMELAKKESDPYHKAFLIGALGQSLTAYTFLHQQLLAADTPVVRSSAAEALIGLNDHKDFPAKLKPVFAGLYKDAINTGDAAVIGIVAGVLADSALGYKQVVKDFSFLRAAREKLSLPRDNEAIQPLEAALAHFEGRKAPAVKNEFNHPIDWALVGTIARDQKVRIQTTKGDIVVRLLVEEAPGSVANFVALLQQGYFDKKFFHRVVPNFVIQAGCNRGDGWGSEDYSIRSEFSGRRYTTGSVGFASAGKDTEGTQWFITHSPTPHLDGRYSIFAEVVSGMDVVDTVEVGDQIVRIALVP
ncbi:peptidylprolyl isomerase [Dawidia soli]|uniref:peptidylprolyl isomerase n=1 Tax=Dawidia soli TaxID=2782352 RepID=A0AAP2GFR2_9BACT|nr:peptidylprolyl isomerase [Dawidia soli]MBT1685356.1 peptidylprolyl isomerase [Dawidia soli]